MNFHYSKCLCYRIPKSPFHDFTWIKHTEDDPHYLHIDDSDFGMKEGYLCEDRWDYLNRIVEEDSKVRSETNISRMRRIFRRFETTIDELGATLKKVFLKSKSAGSGSLQSSPKRRKRSGSKSKSPSPARSDSPRSSPKYRKRSGSESKSPSPGGSKSKSPSPARVDLSQLSPSRSRALTSLKHPEGRKGSSLSLLEVVATNVAKRHRPFRSSTSPNKTFQDESSEKKKVRTTETGGEELQTDESMMDFQQVPPGISGRGSPDVWSYASTEESESLEELDESSESEDDDDDVWGSE